MPANGMPIRAAAIPVDPEPMNGSTIRSPGFAPICSSTNVMSATGFWFGWSLRDRAVFSVFRHAAEVPIYRIEKNPKLARKQGAYSVVSATGLIVRRGPELERVLRALDKGPSLVAV